MSKSKYIDISSIVQIIGSIYNHPQLLEADDKYFFNEEDFVDNFHKIIFGTIYNLYQHGAKSLTLSSIEDYLEQRPKAYSEYKANKGSEYLLRCSENNDFSSFDYYYNKMKKMTLLRGYEKIGMDMSYWYDPDTLDLKVKQRQEDWLDNHTLEEIANEIDDKILSIRMKYVDNASEGGVQAGEGIDKLLKDLKETPEIGYPLYGDYINTVVRGARLKKFYLRSASTGTGKALPNDTIIPTPQGEKRVGNIKPGDYLFDALGKPTKVLQIFPQGEKEVWQITFKDGRTAKCSKDHLWSYCTIGQRIENRKNRIFYTKTLEEISKKDLYKQGRGYQILIPMQKAVEYSEKIFSIKPYTLGLLLGDGSFRYDHTQKALSYSSENEILPKEIAKEMNWNVKKNSDFNYNWTFEWKIPTSHKNVWVEEALKEYPELWNIKSDKKFIPKDYFEGSISQRRDLLNGLLDSDGSVDEKGKIRYCTNSLQLRNDIIKLCHSLGLKATWIEDHHKSTSICYCVEIAGTPEDKISLFKLPRKKELIQKWYNSPKRKELNLFNPVIKIENLGYSTEMTCFLVDNKEHLFLMNDFIVTHNTRSMVADACYIGCSQMYDLDERKWISTGASQSTIFIATEQDLSEVQTMMVAFLSGVNEEHILTSEYYEGEWERVCKAAMLLKNGKIYFESLPDFSLQDIENTIKRGVREHDARYCFLDYLHTSMKILEEITKRSGGVRLREDNILFMLSIKLKDLCNQYGIFIMSATQLNMNYQESETPDQNLLRGAKSIADKVDAGLIMLETTEKDRESLREIVTRNGFEMPDIKISVYKNRRGRWKNIYLWCKADRGICRINPIFATKWNYELCDIENLKISVQDESAF